MAGSFLPSRNSRNAPPPVEMYEILSADAILGDRRERVAAAGDRKRRRACDRFARSSRCRRRTGRTRTRRPGRSTRSCPPCRAAPRTLRASPARCRVSGRRRRLLGARFTSARAFAREFLAAHDVRRDRHAAAARLQDRADLLAPRRRARLAPATCRCGRPPRA